MSGLLPSRRMRWLLLVLACLGAIALFLLATASANTELFAKSIDTLLFVNGALGALLMAVVGTQLWQLWVKRRSGVFGSRLAVRLVLVFALVAVLPGALVYAASVLFIGRSIESWFDVRVDRALEGGLNLGRNALDYLKQETVNKANQIAVTLAEGGPGSLSARLNRAAEQTGVFEAALFTSTGGVLAVAGVGGSTAPPEPPPAAALRRARLQQTTATPEQTPEGVFTKLRVVVPVNTDDQLEPLKVLQVIEPVPRALAQDFETVRSGSDDYQKISISRQGLKRLYGLTLTLTLLLALTSALGPRRRAVRAVLGAAGAACRRHARRGRRRFHAAPTGDVERRARRAHRIVQHDVRAAPRGAAEDRGVAPRDGDHARLPRKHSRQPVGGRARVRRRLSAAHGQRERGGDPAAAADRADRRRAARLGAQAPRARAVRRARRGRLSRRRRRALAEAGGALRVQPDANAADARLATAGQSRRRIRRRVRRRHRSRAGAARRRVGRGGPHGSRTRSRIR